MIENCMKKKWKTFSKSAFLASTNRPRNTSFNNNKNWQICRKMAWFLTIPHRRQVVVRIFIQRVRRWINFWIKLACMTHESCKIMVKSKVLHRIITLIWQPGYSAHHQLVHRNHRCTKKFNNYPKKSCKLLSNMRKSWSDSAISKGYSHWIRTLCTTANSSSTSGRATFF